MENIAVSIIIPVYNKLEYTRKCLESVFKETNQLKFEVVLVDNASTEDVQGLVSRFPHNRLKLLRQETNLGFVGACNAGALSSTGQYIVFLNNDTIVTKGWLDELYNTVEGDPSIGVVGAKLVYPNGILQECGSIVWSDGSGWNYGRGDDPNKPEYEFQREVDYVSGACLLIRRELFMRVKGFDQRYSPGYYEDTDICFVARELGYKVVVQPKSVIYHFEGISSGTDLTSGMKQYQVVNRQKFSEKWARQLRQHHEFDARVIVQAATRTTGSNILIIDQFLPMFDRASGSLRMYNIVKILRDMGQFVTFVARSGTLAEIYADRLQRLGVEVIATDPRKMRDLGYWVVGRTVDMGNLLTARHYDIAWLAFYDVAAQYIDEIRFYSPKTRIVVDSVDVHFLREERRASVASDELSLTEAHETKRKELQTYAKSDVVVTVTENDAKCLQQYAPDMRTYVIPNVHNIVETANPYDVREGLLFIGNFNHPPNSDGIHYFVQHIFPLVQEEIPDIKLFIVGNSSERVALYNNRNIITLGYVYDTQPFLQRARVSIAPLRYGAGMKGKIGEAMMSGLPVVTTSVGAEGMELCHGTTAFIADSIDQFARDVVKLYQDAQVWNMMSLEAKQHVNARYSSQVVEAKLAKLIEELS